jgi:hypothetical protein
LLCGTEYKTERQNLVAVFVAKWQKYGSKLHELLMLRRHRKGDSQMLNEIINGCGGFLVLVMLGIFAAGSAEISSERAEKRRTEKQIREKYGRTY